MRRVSTRDLLAHYRSELIDHGVADAPDLDEVWEWCRRAVIWGLVIGWLITPPENYGTTITVANIERMVSAVADFDALSILAGDPSAPDRST